VALDEGRGVLGCRESIAADDDEQPAPLVDLAAADEAVQQRQHQESVPSTVPAQVDDQLVDRVGVDEVEQAPAECLRFCPTTRSHSTAASAHRCELLRAPARATMRR
jgi:hypothetical protein